MNAARTTCCCLIDASQLDFNRCNLNAILLTFKLLVHGLLIIIYYKIVTSCPNLFN
ncbi:hypothetical protein BDF19DRAFT_438987 [Syncephalis fuscata]|nr:hypothetical protein BDF19DRAFT_438987 [Syncephalis fuscata]